jgi:hypothetical protein
MSSFWLKQKELLIFFNSDAFDEMILKVAGDDMASFKNNNQWLLHHPSKALIFKDSEKVWNSLKETYSSSFKNLVFGELPEEREIFKTLVMIRERLKSTPWII